MGEGGTHSVHLRCILRKSRTCQAIRISFFIPRACSPLLSTLPSTCNPLLRPPLRHPPPRSSYAPFAKRHHLRPFYLLPPPSPSLLPRLALSRNNVDSTRLTSFADTRALPQLKKESRHGSECRLSSRVTLCELYAAVDASLRERCL